MKLVGVGIDVASVARVGGLLDRYGARFERRWFDPVEVAQQTSKRTGLTGRYAVKEAVWKALPHDGTGPLPWRAIVTRSGPISHQMLVELREPLASEAKRYGVTAITASIAVHGDWVLAIAFVEGMVAEETSAGNGQVRRG